MISFLKNLDFIDKFTVLFLFVFVVLFIYTTNYSQNYIVKFQDKCNKVNGEVISSPTKGLTCIRKEAVLFFEK